MGSGRQKNRNQEQDEASSDQQRERSIFDLPRSLVIFIFQEIQRQRELIAAERRAGNDRRQTNTSSSEDRT